MTDLSKTQIDRLGDRLRKGDISEADMRLLDAFRKSFSAAYENVITVIRENLKLEPTGRPAKSTTSIVDKLHREHIRLSQLQDIAGCRIVVEDIQKQNEVVGLIQNIFPSVITVDRRVKPSYGYRAVHLIVKIDRRVVEVQVRTVLQHNWAELSEKCSDKIDSSIKYGGGPKIIQEFLLGVSQCFKRYEEIEVQIANSSGDDEIRILKTRLIELTQNIFNSKGCL